jgi:hypothetical protein
VNLACNAITGFTQTSPDVTFGRNLYPGQHTCRTTSPHALWHESSANGLLELTMLADTLNKYTADFDFYYSEESEF